MINYIENRQKKTIRFGVLMGILTWVLLATTLSWGAIGKITYQVDDGQTLLTIPVSNQDVKIGTPTGSKNAVFIDIKGETISPGRVIINLKKSEVPSPVIKITGSVFQSRKPSIVRIVLYFAPTITGKAAVSAIQASLEGDSIIVRIDHSRFDNNFKKLAKNYVPQKVNLNIVGTDTAKTVTVNTTAPPVAPIDRLVSVSFSQAEISDVIRALAAQSDLNIYAGPEIQGKITFQVQNQPVGKVLSNILDMNGFNYERLSDSSIRVFKKKEEIPVDIKTTAPPVPPTPPVPAGPITKLFAVDYASIQDISVAVNKLLKVDTIQPMPNPTIVGAGEGGNSKVVSGAGTLIVTASPEVMEQVEQLIKKLDKPIRQVMIDVRIVDIKVGPNEDNLGFGWDFDGKNGSKTSFGYGAFFPSVGSIATTLGGLVLSNSPSGNFLFNIAHNSQALQMAISAKIYNQKAELLANPRLIALNNTESKFDLSEELPYVQFQLDQQTNTLTGTAMFDKKAGITMTISPQITSDGNVLLHIVPVQTQHTGDVNVQLSSGAPITAIPVINDRKVDVTMMMKNGQTLVIAGLRSKDSSVTESKIPFLSDIPLLGQLFNVKTKTNTTDELVILVTPYILDNDVSLNTDEKMMYDKLDFF